ncbi:MAG: alpha/beta hydrolase [Alphaproteobacteria bacterium]|nr:alpha/beta hydrolase [Alphaproteobacteria bacterium]
MLKPLLLAFAAALAVAPAAATAAPAPAGAAVSPTRFSVLVEGRGPDVLLIPGLMSGRKVYDRAVLGLAGRYRLHRVQLAGFAGEPARGNGAGEILPAVVEQLDSYIKSHRLRRPILVGHSMGGLIALMLAARHPESVGSVMVVDALPFYSLLFAPDATPETVKPRAAAFRDALASMNDDAWRAQQPQTMASLIRTEAMRPAAIADALASDRRVAAEAVYEVMTTDARPSLAAIRAPVTILYATNNFVPSAAAASLYRGAYQALPGAKLVEMPDSYHFIMYDQPERFQALLAAFLAGRH